MHGKASGTSQPRGYHPAVQPSISHMVAHNAEDVGQSPGQQGVHLSRRRLGMAGDVLQPAAQGRMLRGNLV